MSYGLLKRILAHAKEQGWLNGVIVDPFGGIGSTGILGAYEGYQVICCELEAKFVKLAEQNFKLHDNAWQKFGNPRPVILQGDSRRLCEVVEKVDLVISSPPYVGSEICNVNVNKVVRKDGLYGYGKTPGQLGSMKPGNVDMVVSSPPYAGSMEHSGGIDPSKSKYTGGPHSQMNQSDTRYGQTSGNLGNLKSGDVDCVISSPPFDTHVGGDLCMSSGKNFGHSPGQLLQEQGDTFWSAARTIVEQCFQILKPGGHAIWVTKRFVRAGKIVDFSHDWARLCESVGFEIVCWHKAMLIKETHHDSLFGGKITKTVARKSFFRRLAESKGSPAIDWEDVICMIKK